MGAFLTKEQGNTAKTNGNAKTTKGHNGDVPTKCPELTDKQKDILKEKWKDIENEVEKVGVIMFVRLFENHPGVQDSFISFKGIQIDDVRQMKELHSHSLRVMGLMQKVISRLDSQDKMESIIDDIGRAHFRYGAMPEYMDLVGPQFLVAIRPSLSEQWSAETEEAWLTLFTLVSWRMKKAIQEEATKANIKS